MASGWVILPPEYMAVVAGLDLDACDSPAGNSQPAPEIAFHRSKYKRGGNNQGWTALWASHEACVRHTPCRGCLAGGPN